LTNEEIATMSQRLCWIVASLGSAALAVGIGAHAAGCSEGPPVVGTCTTSVDPQNPCKLNECKDGSGVVQTPVPDNTQCTASAGEGKCESGTCKLAPECMRLSCDANKLCTFEAEVAGNHCVAGQSPVCDGKGACVPCLESTNKGCEADQLCYALDGKLQCLACSNGKRDGDETDVDCGGSCSRCGPGPCKPCGLGGACSSGVDCKNHICGPKGNVCCEVPCVGVCKSCAQGTGKCEEVPTGTADPGCAADKVCAQGADCVFRAWHACMAGSDCMSNVCGVFENGMWISKCAPGGQNYPCVDASDCAAPFSCNLASKMCQ
jgi:hypothetical protein